MQETSPPQRSLRWRLPIIGLLIAAAVVAAYKPLKALFYHATAKHVTFDYVERHLGSVRLAEMRTENGRTLLSFEFYIKRGDIQIDSAKCVQYVHGKLDSDSAITIEVYVGWVGSHSTSSSVDLPALAPGKHELRYRDPDGSMHIIGEVEVVDGHWKTGGGQGEGR